MPSPPDLPEWLLQVRDTLATLGVMDADLRDEVVRQVQEAVDATEADGDDRSTPSMTVLRGGRGTPDDPSSPHPASPDDDDDHDRSYAGLPPHLQLVDDEPGGRVHVQVLRSGRPSPPAAADLQHGHLQAPVGPEIWQTFAHGESPAVYRVHCDQGAMIVASEAEVVLRLRAGQSVDLTGLVLRVTSDTEEPAFGRYRRLAGEA